MINEFKIRPYRLPIFCELLIWLTYLIIILNIFKFRFSTPTSLFPIILPLILSYFCIEQLLFDTGAITIQNQGFTVKNLFNKSTFFNWNEIQIFQITPSKLGTSIGFKTKSNRTHVLLFEKYYPLSAHHLDDYLTHLLQHAMYGSPIKDFASYEKVSFWFNIPTVCCFAFSFVWLLIYAINHTKSIYSYP